MSPAICPFDPSRFIELEGSNDIPFYFETACQHHAILNSLTPSLTKIRRHGMGRIAEQRYTPATPMA